MSTTLTPAIGHILKGYRVEHLFGKGRVSVAFLASHVVSGQKVMVTTLLLPDNLPHEANQRFRARFHKGSEILSELSHPHLLPILEYGEYGEGGYPFLITESTEEGASLAMLLKQQGRLSQEATCSIIEQVASGLDYAHAHNIWHGNLTPAMILLRHGHVQMVGLGMRSLLEAHTILSSTKQYAYLCDLWGNYLGDPRALAPECVLGQPVDGRSDIYALGVLLRTLLTGEPLFRGQNYMEIAMQHLESPSSFLLRSVRDHELSPAIEVVLSKAQAQDPMQRFQTARDVFVEYEKAIASSPSPGVQGSIDEMPTRTLKHLNVIQRMPVQVEQPLRNQAVSVPTLEQQRMQAMVREIEAHIWDGYQLPKPDESIARRLLRWITSIEEK